MNENTGSVKQNCKIHVVDAIMGTGKTNAAINYINGLPDDVKVMYVTPYNNKDDEDKPNEVKRIIEACREKEFVEPYYVNNRKVNSLKELMLEGRNIATTHALFHLMALDKELVSLCKEQGYILFMDEVTEVIKTYKGIRSKHDLDLLINGEAKIDEITGELVARPFVKADERGVLHWVAEGYYGKFTPERELMRYGALASCSDYSVLIELFPVELFNAFEEVFIMTYMFDCQLQSYYYKYYGLQYDYLYVKGNCPDDHAFTANKEEQTKKNIDYKSLIHIYTDPKIDEGACKKNNALSVSWFKSKHKKKSRELVELKNSVYNFFRRGTKKGRRGKGDKKDTKKRLWTTYGEFEYDIRERGYKDSFLSINARATNKFRTCDAVAYVANRYLNPLEKRFFEMWGITVNQDEFALSEMLQFIWRSAIRDGKPIDVYIPSKRMRELLEKWIEENSVSSVNTAP